MNRSAGRPCSTVRARTIQRCSLWGRLQRTRLSIILSASNNQVIRHGNYLLLMWIKRFKRATSTGKAYINLAELLMEAKPTSVRRTSAHLRSRAIPPWISIRAPERLGQRGCYPDGCKPWGAPLGTAAADGRRPGGGAATVLAQSMFPARRAGRRL